MTSAGIQEELDEVTSGKSTTWSQIWSSRLWVAHRQAANASLQLVVTLALSQPSQLPRLSERACGGAGRPNFSQRFTPTAELDTVVCWASCTAAI